METSFETMAFVGSLCSCQTQFGGHNPHHRYPCKGCVLISASMIVMVRVISEDNSLPTKTCWTFGLEAKGRHSRQS